MLCERFPAVYKLYAVELVPDVVRLLQPITIPALCGDAGTRIIRVVGSFDEIELSDASVDFYVEVASLHHSNDLDHTLGELARVLKPGGLLLALDRAHHDKLSEAQRTFMLDVEYPDWWKRENGYDTAPLKRRDNGEHEIRLCEWFDAFARAGFTLERHLELRTVGWRKLLRGAVLTLPFTLRRRLGWLPSRARWHDGEWCWMLGRLLGLHRPDRRFRVADYDYSLFLVRHVGA